MECGCEQTNDLDHELAFFHQTAIERSMAVSTEVDLQNAGIANIAIYAEMLRRLPNASIIKLSIGHDRLMIRAVDSMRVTRTKHLLLDSEMRHGVQISSADQSA